MQVLKITRSAYRVIEQKSINADKKKLETGGLLIGTLKKLVVLKASRSGSNARATSASYTNDSEYDNRMLLQTIREFNGKVKKVGYWHRHPGNMSHPSAGDLRQAQEIMRINERERDKRPILFIITNVMHNKVKLYGYCLAPDQKIFSRVAVKIVKDNSREIEKALNMESIIIQQKEMDFWNSDNFQFYLTKNGYARLKQEVDELKKHGYDVKIYARDQMYLTIKNNETILCFPPAEYPLNPPRFFRNNIEITYRLPMWNSSYRIIHILENLEKSGILKRRKNESFYTKTSSNLLRFFRYIKKTIKSLWFHKRK